ncbi:hypothetical protein DXG03_002672 [Asterophora parasitica]|uniref:Voltage-gated hydrogen channel 1 n=1 Tax=Asterophora parasitica TaxID=117018 RepID=A0A9P7G9T4_9AGAR|nr:hypothetical protein DXG03_002672 [Asterophora parasitica]
MSEEQQPLLPVASDERNAFIKDETMTWRARTRALLESPRFHIAVIVLIALDATCVLADLTYSLLSPECGKPPGDLPPWLEVLAHISLVITSFFMVEIPLSLAVFGTSYYNPFGPVIHAGLHLFDAAIIITTFVLEVALKGRERELAGLLIILRLWRLVKLVGGKNAVYMSAIHDLTLWVQVSRLVLAKLRRRPHNACQKL